MSVYIKGMEMPTDAPVIIKICPDGSVSRVHEGVVAHAIPVPDHGDLVCRDDMHEMLNWTISKPPFSRKSIRQMIDAAPTIIPASEEVYDKYTDTAGNLHWTGTKTGHYIIPAGHADKERV